ncbi:unnamed protein product [Cylicocyclus nassatus]|uniref:F-box domain-containing protein n=1 Tax=Cylicocyclus nassatus TaxID=53992 RepID=A0AA36M6N4_CYLNA|nr:unnamed protein product [Cylicocyclus nassatus]
MSEISISSHDVDVLEKRFTCWNSLPMELKVKVVRNLPYPTLRNFMFLSKECMEIALLLKASVHAVFLLDAEYGMDDEDGVRGVRSFAKIVVNDRPHGSSDADSESYTIGFAGRSCIARRIKKEGQNVGGLEYPMESCYAVSMRVLFQITKYLKPEIVGLELVNIRDVKGALRKLPSTSSLTCEALTVRSTDLSFLPMLMPHVTPGCQLRFQCDPFSFGVLSNNVNSEVFDFEVVKAAPFIDIDVNCDISDEQLVHLRASELRVTWRAPGISEKGLNGLILQWMEGRRKIVRICITTKTFNYDMIFENVDKTKVQSNSLELLQIPFFDKYVESYPRYERLALLRNGLGDRLLVNISFNFCEIVDPYSEYMSRYR